MLNPFPVLWPPEPPSCQRRLSRGVPETSLRRDVLHHPESIKQLWQTSAHIWLCEVAEEQPPLKQVAGWPRAPRVQGCGLEHLITMRSWSQLNTCSSRSSTRLEISLQQIQCLDEPRWAWTHSKIITIIKSKALEKPATKSYLAETSLPIELCLALPKSAVMAHSTSSTHLLSICEYVTRI